MWSILPPACLHGLLHGLELLTTSSPLPNLGPTSCLFSDFSSILSLSLGLPLCPSPGLPPLFPGSPVCPRSPPLSVPGFPAPPLRLSLPHPTFPLLNLSVSSVPQGPSSYQRQASPVGGAPASSFPGPLLPAQHLSVWVHISVGQSASDLCVFPYSQQAQHCLMSIYYLSGAAILFTPLNPYNFRVKEDYLPGMDKEIEVTSHHPHNLQPLGPSFCCLPGCLCLPLSGSAHPHTPGTHLKEALPFAQAAPLQTPEVDVGFPAGDEQGGVCGVEGGHQHSLVGALWGVGEILNEDLKATRATPRRTALYSCMGYALHNLIFSIRQTKVQEAGPASKVLLPSSSI